MSLSERISRGFKASLVAQVIDIVSNAALILILARFLLTPDEYGLLYYAISIITTISIVGTIGVPSSTARYVTEYAEKDESQVRYILRFGFGVVTAMSITVGVVLALVSSPLASYLQEPEVAPFLAIGFGYILFEALSSYITSVFQGFNRVEWSAVVNSTSWASRVIFATAFVLLGFGALGALMGYVAGFVLATVVGLYVLYDRFYTEYESAAEFESGLRRRILEYSVPLTVTRSANVLDKKIDTVLIGIFLNMSAVGYYTIAKQISSSVSMPASSLGFTISPTFGEQKASNQIAQARRVYQEAFRHIILLYIPAAVGLILVAEPLIQYVFGPEYTGAVLVLQVMAGFTLVNAVNKITSDGLDYLGRARERAIVKMAAAVANFVLNLLLIPTIGVVGAAIATVITYTAYTLANVYIIHQELTLEVRKMALTTGLVCGISVGMGLAVVAAMPYVSNVITLFVVVGIGVVVWAVLATVSGLLDIRKVAAFLS
ncbi:flippase (plasmid) [Haloferacaceae archaeon DSL9]